MSIIAGIILQKENTVRSLSPNIRLVIQMVCTNTGRPENQRDIYGITHTHFKYL